MTKLYCLETPKGEVIWWTISPTKRDVWGKSFDFVGEREPGFTTTYWHKWEASLAKAKRLGYKFVPVKVVKEII
jgi:hypothetical protein